MNNTVTLIVLFNLKKGVLATDYEHFARTQDSPVIRSLNSNRDFKILKATGLSGSDTRSPYQYIEVMEVSSFEELDADFAQPQVQSMLKKFLEFAENPQIIFTSRVN